MLLEFQNITKSSLLFGSTWLVNSFTITAVLLLILLANLVTYYFHIKDVRPFYFLLCGSILVLYLLPLHKLNIHNYYLKATLIEVFLNIPIFLQGLFSSIHLKNPLIKI